MMNADTDETDRLALEWNEGDMPYSTAFGDHFYCRTDGRAECGHVFLAGNGLPGRWRREGNFRIGELGFGTGLNACETFRQWQLTRLPGTRLDFVSFELHPMDRASIHRALSRWPELDQARDRLCAAWPDRPSETISIDMGDDFHLTVICGDAGTSLAASPLYFDAWYLDGFAPSRNPDMWSAELMALVHAKTMAGGSFATYAAAGFVRRNLQSAGFKVIRSPGFAGKREMLSGTKAG